MTVPDPVFLSSSPEQTKREHKFARVLLVSYVIRNLFCLRRYEMQLSMD